MLESLKEIPDWFGEALTNFTGWFFATVFAVIGGIIKTVWDIWQRHRLPFKSDQKRFEWVINTAKASDIQYFLFTENYGGISGLRAAAVFDAAEAITLDTQAKFLNKKLRTKEEALQKKLNAFAECISIESAPHRSIDNVYTIKVIDFDSGNPYHIELYRKSEQKLFEACKAAMAAYEDFRDFGTRYFAVKLEKAQVAS